MFSSAFLGLLCKPCVENHPNIYGLEKEGMIMSKIISSRIDCQEKI